MTRTNAAPSASFRPGLSLVWKFALRELRGGLGGFYIFLGCIALGVAAISGVSSVAVSITQGISTEGRAILGGDMSFSLVQRGMDDDQRQSLETRGKISTLVTMRAMARKTDGSDQSLIELKAVEANTLFCCVPLSLEISPLLRFVAMFVAYILC